MVDLLVYLRNLPGASGGEFRLLFGDPSAGGLVFEQHGCVDCHQFGDGKSGKVDLLSGRADSPTLSMLAVEMWNHRPRMVEAAKRKALAIKSFANEQMRDLLSCLLAKGYFEQTGNPGRGAAVFRRKQCSTCHDGGGVAPERPRPGKTVTATDFAAAVWRHGPQMVSLMSNRGIPWPTLSGKDVGDLTAYLSTH